MNRKNVLIVCLIASLLGCAEKPKKATVAPLPMVGTFKARELPVNGNDKIIVVDVPDYYMPRRCVIYVGKNSSNMDCTFDATDNATVVNALRATD